MVKRDYEVKRLGLSCNLFCAVPPPILGLQERLTVTRVYFKHEFDRRMKPDLQTQVNAEPVGNGTDILYHN